MANNVVIKKRVAAFTNDTYNRTAVCASDLDNGCVFALNSYSETEGEDTVWVATAPATADDTGLYMATSPEVVITKVGDIEMKGVIVDPRYFVNIAGKMIDCIRLVPGDIVEMSGEGIADIDTANFLIPAASSSFKLKKNASAGNGCTLKKIGTTVMAFGNAALNKAPVKGYKFEVVKN